MEIRPLETITRLGLFDCDVSPDGQIVAAIYQEDDGYRLGVWYTTACNSLLDLTVAGAHRQPRFSPDGRRLAASRQGQEVTVWSLPEGRQLLSQARSEGSEFTAHAFGPRGETLAIAQDDEIGFWEVAGGAWQASVAMPSVVRTLKSSPDGHLLGVGLQVGGALVLDFEARNILAALPDIRQPVTALAFHPEQSWLLTATAPSFTTSGRHVERTEHGWAQLWNYRTTREILQLPCDYQATLLGEGHYLATLTNNSRSLWIWSIPETDIVAHIENAVPELLIEEQGQEVRRATLAASAAGDLLAVAGLARSISAVGTLRLFAFRPEAVPQA